VYFGGGTPSLMSISDFEKLFEIFMPFTTDETEITIEANPSSWDEQKAKALLRMGANRLSLGVQSLDDEKLRFLSRVHDAASAVDAYKASVSAGFTNISVDLIYDTKFDDEAFLQKELDKFLALDATHVSAYSLTIEEGTPFERTGVKTRYDIALASNVAQRLMEAGYEHYEVASFGKKRSKHNFGYWEYKPYIGVGAGAVGFDGKNRLYPHKEIEKYIEEPLFADTEELSQEDNRLEKILLGLRSKVGVKLAFIKNEKELQMLAKDALISIVGDTLYCEDFFLADEIAARLS
jgi:oxygen-independent coproporphyrinogen III oxidase